MDHKHLHQVFQFLIPIFAMQKPRFTATVDFPTPPLALETKIVDFVPLIGILINCLRRFLAHV